MWTFFLDRPNYVIARDTEMLEKNQWSTEEYVVMIDDLMMTLLSKTEKRAFVSK